MTKVIITLMAIGLFVLAGCGASGPKKADSVEDIGGTWRRTSGGLWYIAFHEDGTINGSAYLEAVVEGRGHDEWKYRFLGTQLIMQGSGGHCEDNQIGIFEVHLLENGNLKFFTIEDECASRAGQLAGRPDDGITREYEPVP